MSRARAKRDPLVGKFFHSRSDAGAIKWQGVISERVNDDHYLAQLFDWLVGDPSTLRVVSLAAMSSWTFYVDVEDMTSAYENENRRPA